MVRFLAIIPFALLVSSAPVSALHITALPDSIGVELIEGKVFVKHKVEPKETLYALSRKYGVTVAQIVEANPKVENTISIGQVVLIPRNRASASKTTRPVAVPAYNGTTTAAANAAGNNAATTAPANNEKVHVVEPKQTLYAISRLYNVSVEDIIRWNKMTSNQINVGGRLVVSNSNAAGSTGYALASATDTVTPVPVEKPVPAAATLPATEPATRTPEPAVEEEAEAGIKKIMENGMAEMIDPKADTDKYLALHRAAPVGTIMQVKNAMNGQVVYVRVIGKLPETGANDKVVVKLSRKAYQKLGAVDSRFRVELSYVP